MGFNDYYATAQYCATVTLVMLAILQVTRWWRAAGAPILVTSRLLGLYAIGHALIAAKQAVWGLRGAMRAANVGGPTIVTDPSPMSMVLNFAIALTVVAIFGEVSRGAGTTQMRIVAGCAIATGLIAMAVGGYNG